MATIAENLERIQQAKADIKSAIEAKGVTVPSSATIDTYDDYVAQISGGGGSTADTAALKGIIDRSITSIDIPSGVTTIGAYAFANCTSITSCTIGSGVTSIGGYAFNTCSSLTSIDIPNSVTTIGDYAFANCRSLSSIDISSGVTSISDRTFQNCTSLTSVTILDSVTSIGNSAFQYCSSLTSCTIGSGVTSIDRYAFQNCTSLTSITVNATTPPTLSNANAFSNTNNCPIYVPTNSVDTYKTANNWSTYASRIQAIPLPPIPKWIATYTTGTTSAECDSTSAITRFEITLQNLVDVQIGDCATRIDYGAFQYCNNLSGVTIPDSVTSIGDGAFQYCFNLSGVTIQATMPPTLGEDVFSMTPIANGNGWIYVPDESVMDYQNNWSEYQSQIRGISEL